MTESHPEPDPLSSAIGRVTARLRDGRFSGEAARLRRLSPDDPASSALFQILAACVEPVLPMPTADADRTALERRWAVVLQALAQTPELLDGQSDLGRELAECGFAELRFERLLRADEDAIPDQVRTMAAYLASKGRRMNPFDVSRLVLLRAAEPAERIRRKIARSYYKTLAANSKMES